MSDSNLEDLLRSWSGESLVIRQAQTCDATILIGIHSTQLGPATGGTRMKKYDSLESAVEDVMKLSAGMTLKFALGEVNRGGGKAVIRIAEHPSAEQRRKLMLEYGSLIGSLGGTYCTGPDSGTTPEDMNIIAETGGSFVHGCTVDRGGAGGTGYLTAVGVAAAMRAVARHVWNADSLDGLTIAMQGAGSVGLDLIKIVTAEGAKVLVNEVRSDALQAAVSVGAVEFGGDVSSAECDVFAPCAFGGILNRASLKTLRCRAIVGSANNQLESPRIADQISGMGITYSPDFLTSMGAAIGVPGIETDGWTHEYAASQVDERITRALTDTLAYSAKHAVNTNAAAQAIALERLKRAT